MIRYDDFNMICFHFKVEIVGDGYLVASGLPKPNGDLHASEISRMALQLMSLVAAFEVISLLLIRYS